MLPVNEIYQTIQGEGRFTGLPSVFVRLQGCDVGCPWCDTKHTWALDEQDATDDTAAIIDKSKDSPTWARLYPADITKEVLKLGDKHVVITGGEPCLYDLNNLCLALLEEGLSVQIETSGTRPIQAPNNVWVTLSPKFNMPGGRPLLVETIHRADEIKMPVGKKEDIKNLTSITPEIGHRASVYLQPLSQSPKATELCIQACHRYGWRLSAQTHKYIQIR